MNPQLPLILGLSGIIANSNLLAQSSSGQDLDDLLKKDVPSAQLAESENFKKLRQEVMDLLAQRKYQEADPKLSALSAEKGYILPRHRDFIRLVSKAVRFQGSLEADKEDFRNRFKKVGASVVEYEGALNTLQLEAANVMKVHGNRIPPTTKQSMDKRYISLQTELAKLRKTHKAMQEEAKNFEAARLVSLEGETTEWINSSESGEDVSAGLILSATYLDQVGNSDSIRGLSQTLHEKQEALAKADKIVSVIEKEVEVLIQSGKAEEAKVHLSSMIAKVEASDINKITKDSAVRKLRSIDLITIAATKNESVQTAQIDKRLDYLEKNLSRVQDGFSSVITSFEGFTEVNLSVEGDRERAKKLLTEKIKSGQITKEKTDNMIKAKAEHSGLLKELEEIEKESAKLSVIQRGIVANLKKKAEIALDLMKDIPLSSSLAP